MYIFNYFLNSSIYKHLISPTKNNFNSDNYLINYFLEESIIFIYCNYFINSYLLL